MPYNYDRLAAEVVDELTAAQFLQNLGIIHRERRCHCGSEMRQSTMNEHGNIIPCWRCKAKNCKATKGLRPDTWLSSEDRNSYKLPLTTIVKFIYWWSVEQTSILFCERELGMNKNTVVDWSMFMREICAYHILQHQGQIGGNGMTVEIDESLFVKRKNNQGRIMTEQWCFGGICRESRECFMYAVPDRTRDTLMAVINEKIAPGTRIVSDCWRAYNMVVMNCVPSYYYFGKVGANGGFTHQTVNHQLHFVDPHTGAHTQTVERMWRSAKKRNKEHSGTHRHMLDSYFCEFLWRADIQRRNVDPFEEILHTIAQFMPPE